MSTPLKNPVVAIDGPAGSGKSTVARAVAEALGLPTSTPAPCTGPLTWAVLDAGIDPADAAAVVGVAQGLDLDVGPPVRVGGRRQRRHPHARGDGGGVGGGRRARRTGGPGGGPAGVDRGPRRGRGRGPRHRHGGRPRRRPQDLPGGQRGGAGPAPPAAGRRRRGVGRGRPAGGRRSRRHPGRPAAAGRHRLRAGRLAAGWRRPTTPSSSTPPACPSTGWWPRCWPATGPPSKRRNAG